VPDAGGAADAHARDRQHARIYVGSGDLTSVSVIDGVTHGTIQIPAVWQSALLAINTVTNKGSSST
jgi:hypothetical protein